MVRPGAKDDAELFLVAEFHDALAAILGDSVVRGDSIPTSDLDLVVVTHRGQPPYRESFEQFGWLIETFVHTPTSYRDYFDKDIGRGPPELALSEISDFRYRITNLIDDLVDSEHYDESLFTANDLSVLLCDLLLGINRRWTGRDKWVMRALERYDIGTAGRLTAALQQSACSGGHGALVSLADEVLAEVGGRLFDGYNSGRD